MTAAITDKDGRKLQVKQECDRAKLRWLVEQAIDRSQEKKQDIAEAVDLAPTYISPALNSDATKWDYARVRIVEWWFDVEVETITTISDWSDGRTSRTKTFKLYPK